MAGSYEIWLITDRYERSIITPLWFTSTRTTGRIGYFQMGLPPQFDESLLKRDRMIQIWRAPSGGALSLWQPFFLRKWRLAHGVDGQEFITIEGPDVNDLLRRRIVAYYANEDEAQATATEADDLMKDIVAAAIADGTAPAPDDGTRVWANLSVQGDLSDGPQLTKNFAWRQLLTPAGMGILPELAQASREAGTEVFFDIVPDAISATSITFEFRTYTGQPGADLTSGNNRVTFSQERSNMREPSITYDYTQEQNYIYAGGQGQEDGRNIQQVYDDDRTDASIWNRCEGFADARSQDTDNGVREAGRAMLEEGRPRITFTATPIDTRDTRFGKDWNFGDKVRAVYRDVEYDAIIRSSTLSVNEEGRETVGALLDYRE